jgi:3-keto-disaccharide hydrolase
MRSCFVIVIAVALSGFLLNGATAQPASDGFVALFDGKNLEHWQGNDKAQFTIEDGAIVAKGKKDPKDNAFLISKDKYKDFQLRVEVWASEDANSGVFIRCEDPANPGAKTCYECNIFDTRPDPSYGTGAIVFFAEVSPMPKAGGKWNTMEIMAKGRDLSVTFNGQKTAQVRNGLHPEGVIALQFAEGTVKFRKVEIKPL